MSNVSRFVGGGVVGMLIASCAGFLAFASIGLAGEPTRPDGRLKRMESGSAYGEPHRIGCNQGKALARRFLASKGMQESGTNRAEVLEDTDVLHYQLDFEVSNLYGPGGVTITGSNRMSVRSLTANLTEFTFRLHDVFTITGAYLNDTTPATVSSENWTTRVVTLDRPYGVGEEFTLTIEYTGSPTGIYQGQQSGIPFVATLSEAWWSFTFWPVKDGDIGDPGDNSEKATMEFSITVPDNFDVPSNGVLQSVDVLPGNRARYNWASNYPNSAYGVSFAVSEYNRWTGYYDHAGGSMPVEFYIYDSVDTPGHRADWDICIDMLGVFAELFGEYPFIDEKYGIYSAPWGGGMEHQTMTGQGGNFGFFESLTAHELAHSWWGNMITCKHWNDMWLNEGFATYGEALWEEFKDGTPNAFAYYNSMQDNKPFNAGAGGTVYIYPWELTEGRIFSGTYSYAKGAWVLHQLRGVVGDEAFFDIIAAYRAAYAYSGATTEQFIALASATYGEDLAWFFDQWVYNAGAPAYEYGWKTENIDGQDYLYVRISQTQGSPDPEVFTMPVRLAVTTGRSSEAITVWNDEREQYYVLSVSGPVSGMLFDPFEWILRTGAVSAPYAPVAPSEASAPHDTRKNRYVSFVLNNEKSSAVQVDLTASGEFPGSTGVLGWVGEPDSNSIARVAAQPYYSDSWPSVVHVGDCRIHPASTYELRATWDGVAFSEPLEVGTILKPGVRYYGDVVGEGTGDMPPANGFTPPNRVVNVTDMSAYLLTAQGSSTPSAPTTWVDLHGLGAGSPPNFILNISDLQNVLFGFEGQRYADAPEHFDPADCP